MRYKQLGETDLMVPEVGLGTLHYRGGLEPLRKGIELGACLIDTAEAYGTEEVVGQAIRGLRNRVIIATKVLPRNFRRVDLLRAADRSLQQLKTDCIDLYQLHWPNAAVPIAETMGVMEELVEKGKIRYIGVSNFSVTELKHAQAALSRNRIVSNQVRYNLVERSIEGSLLHYCRRARITIIAFSPLARGISFIRQNDPNGILGQVARSAGRSEAQVALNWCIAKEEIIAIPKADLVEHMRENVEASDWRLAPEQMALLDSEIRFRRRGPIEGVLRRFTRSALQRMGRSQ